MNESVIGREEVQYGRTIYKTGSFWDDTSAYEADLLWQNEGRGGIV